MYASSRQNIASQDALCDVSATGRPSSKLSLLHRVVGYALNGRANEALAKFRDVLTLDRSACPQLERGGPSAGLVQARSVVFLQGPAGTTFEQIGRALRGRGHQVVRVNFNFGDQLFWRLPGAIGFRFHASAWPAFLEKLLRRKSATDMVLFGDCRPLHRDAIEVAKRNGVAVHVLEEGYLRPNWVTLERDGVNGHSALPTCPEWFLQQQPLTELQGAAADQPYSFARRAIEDVIYHLGRIAGWPLYPFYTSHRPWHPLVEYAGWVRRLAGQKAEDRRSALEIERLRANGRPYFLFPLQLDCDFQIRVHSSFGSLRPALQLVLSSFAQHAPAEALLVIKQHPLENGLRDWRRTIGDIATPLGVAARVVFLEAGNLSALLKDASGMVTINSTSGMDALAADVPLIALGNAIYDMPGLTNGKDLDRFWQSRLKPRPELVAAFRTVLLQRCLIPGGFYSAAGIRSVVAGVVTRLEGASAQLSLPSGATMKPELEVKACG